MSIAVWSVGLVMNREGTNLGCLFFLAFVLGVQF